MNRPLFALLAGCILGGCTLLDPSADTSPPVPIAEHDYITGSRLPARNHNAAGTKVYELNAIDKDEMLRPKSSNVPQ